MSFAGAPAAAGARGDGNAAEDDQIAGVSGVQPEPQAAVRSVIRHSLNLHKSSRVNKWLDLSMNVSFSSEITTSWIVLELIFCYVALGCHSILGHTV